MGLFYCTNSTVRLLFFQLMKFSKASNSGTQVDTWGAGMHPDYVIETKQGDVRRTHCAIYKWGDSTQSKEFLEPGAGIECERITGLWIETSGRYHYLVTQIESDGTTFNFKVDYPKPGQNATPKLYNYLLNLAGLFDVKGSYEVKFKVSAGGTRGACFINFAVSLPGGGWRGADQQVFDYSDINGVIGLIQQRLGVTPSFEPIELGKPVEDYVSKRKNNKLVSAS